MRLLRALLLLVLVAVVLLLANYVFVSGFSSAMIYDDLKRIPPKRAALLLGTSKYIAKGKINYFYRYRIDAAVALWKAGKVRAIVVSGDNGTRYYNETRAMYRDLIKAGVPARYIARDYAGFRTLDSIVRAGNDFGLDDYIVVSQRFHLQRALYIAHAKGQKAIGFAARSVPYTLASVRMFLREVAARAVMMADLYLLHTTPKYWGGKVKVRYRQ